MQSATRLVSAVTAIHSFPLSLSFLGFHLHFFLFISLCVNSQPPPSEITRQIRFFFIPEEKESAIRKKREEKLKEGSEKLPECLSPGRTKLRKKKTGEKKKEEKSRNEII